MPDATRPKLRFPSDLSRDDFEIPVLTSVTIVDAQDTITAVIILTFFIHVRILLFKDFGI